MSQREFISEKIGLGRSSPQKKRKESLTNMVSKCCSNKSRAVGGTGKRMINFGGLVKTSLKKFAD